MKNSIVRSIDIAAPPSRVWKALTDHRQFGEWFRVSIDGPFVVGEPSRGKITSPGYEGLPWEARIQKRVPESLFSYTWAPGAAPGSKETEAQWTLVEFRLEKIPKGTRLTVTESGFEKLPAKRRAGAIRENSEGWTIQMKNVRKYVAAGA